MRENLYSMEVFQTGEETPLQAFGVGIVDRHHDTATPPGDFARRASTVREQPVTSVN
jgi:hypothetical protein